MVRHAKPNSVGCPDVVRRRFARPFVAAMALTASFGALSTQAALADGLPAGDATTTIGLSGGVTETLIGGPSKPLQTALTTTVATDPKTTCNPTCGNNGPMPPVTLADTGYVKYGQLNGDLEASESSYLTGSQGAFTYNTQFGNSVANFYWLGTKPSFNWASYAPSMQWIQTGLDVSVSLPPGVGFSAGGNDVKWAAGQGGSGHWAGTVSYQQKVTFAAFMADKSEYSSAASVWFGSNPYGVSADSSDHFGPAY